MTVLLDPSPAGQDAPPIPAAIPDANPVIIGGRRERRLAADSKGARELPTGDDTEAPPARPPLSPGRGTAAWILATVSLLALWFAFYAVVLTPFQESRLQTVNYSTLREELSQQVAPLGGNIPPGSPVALMTAPTLGLSDVVVVEGTSSGDLMAGPGHKSDTVLPGQAGVSVLYGRASLFAGPFASIHTAHAGDKIQVITGQGTFVYSVTRVRRPGDPLPAALTGSQGLLTLVTSDNAGTRLGALHPSGVVYVDAALQGQGQASPGHPEAVPLAEEAMQGDPSALLWLAIALPMLVLAVLFLVWARVRWGGWQAWLIGAPLTLAALWAVSTAAVQLLPNLL